MTCQYRDVELWHQSSLTGIFIVIGIMWSILILSVANAVPHREEDDRSISTPEHSKPVETVTKIITGYATRAPRVSIDCAEGHLGGRGKLML